MSTKIRLLAVLVVLAMTAAACGGGDGGTATTVPPTGAPDTTVAPTAPPDTSGIDAALARADVPRATVTDVDSAEIVALVAGNREFAFDLFRLAAADGGNVLLSPYSVAAALTMTYAGARGDTAAEMRDALYLGLPDERVHAARNELDLRITAEPGAAPGDDREPFTIRVANSLWGQQGYPFLGEFLELLAANYDAGMNLVDFVTAAEEARQTINAWVEEQTEGRIVDLIPEGVITDLTRLVLVNAIWFKANWAEQFDPDLTADGAFTTLAGAEVMVPMMVGGGRMHYAAGDGYQALRIPYAGDASMLVLLPDEGRFAEIADGLGPELLAEARRTQAEYQVELTMPKFEYRSEFALKPALQELGIVAAFTEPSRPGGADLTGMTAERELFVHEVVHQAFIAVDEEGTEAAAATAVIVGLEMAAPGYATVVIDRPFLFVIEHDGTGELLFIGQVTDPS